MTQEVLRPYSATVSIATATQDKSSQAPSYGDLKHKLIRAGILVAVFTGVGIAIIALMPGLSGVGPAIKSASTGWVLAAVGGAVASRYAGSGFRFLTTTRSMRSLPETSRSALSRRVACPKVVCPLSPARSADEQ
jgi:hypothetical protein